MTTTARVIESYTVAYPNPIKLKEGETVLIEKWEPKDSEWAGWVFCVDQRGIKGWVSEKYLRINRNSATVTRSYDATELTVEKGETIKVHHEEFGWAWVENINGAMGWVPLKSLLSTDSAARILPRISTDRLILRLPTLDDASEILRYFKENESHLSRFDPKRPDGFYTEKFWKERIPKHLENFLADNAVRFFLFSRSDDKEIIGSMEFSQISRGPFQACYLGYGIAQKHQGHGLMYEGLHAAIRYAFDELNIHRIMANHLPDNERSARLLQRLGFVRECIAKDYLFINGAWRDHVLNSLSNSNWRENGGER